MSKSLKRESCFDQTWMFLFLNSWYTSSVEFSSSKSKRQTLPSAHSTWAPGKEHWFDPGMLIAYVLLWAMDVKETGCGESLASLVISCFELRLCSWHFVAQIKMNCIRCLWELQMKWFSLYRTHSDLPCNGW